MDARFAKKYRDPRWQKRRLEVLQAADFACENCGDSKKELHVHHSFYVKGREPWEYKDGLVALCAGCHEDAETARRRLVELLSRTGSRASIHRIIGYIIGLSFDGAELFDNILDAEEAEGLADALPHYSPKQAVETYTTCAPYEVGNSEIVCLNESMMWRQRLWGRNAKDGTNGSVD